MADAHVVLSITDISEEEFHPLMVLGLLRVERALGGRRQLAAAMDLSTKQVGNIMRSGSTDPKRLFDTWQHGSLDDIADRYGFRVVPKGAVCSSDVGRSSLTVLGLLQKLMEAEADGKIDHSEKLGMEPDLRAVRSFIDRMLEDIADLRRPRGVAA
ncbi:hypothetical protein [Sphingomonas parapaucimobilis]|uniref:Uncharacterized protein n=1 Tax=Sphingomonas parapaucimobilis NBRC 15100 TaxID=1219049 RepID=A0A0A1W9Q9_9SPHN|nr:hypothetical protein [Sphingomonas parapaucimobilis]GAM01902.1 hypothetical protein SP5_069_01460 [Sphingomonas parapaucimobilis NBRC 15100]